MPTAETDQAAPDTSHRACSAGNKKKRTVYQAFRSKPPREYESHTKPAFAHTMPARVVTKAYHPPPSPSPPVLPFSVCTCKKDKYIDLDILRLPALRGCPSCISLPLEDEGLSCGGSTAPPSARSVVPSPVIILPPVEERLAPLPHALQISGRSSAAFKAAVQRRVPPFPFSEALPQEKRDAVNEYQSASHTAHIFYYLKKDMIRDRPTDIQRYALEWMKRRRAHFSSGDAAGHLPPSSEPAHEQ